MSFLIFKVGNLIGGNVIDTALGVKVLRVGCQAVESGVRTSNGSSIGFEIGRK